MLIEAHSKVVIEETLLAVGRSDPFVTATYV